MNIRMAVKVGGLLCAPFSLGFALPALTQIPWDTQAAVCPSCPFHYKHKANTSRPNVLGFSAEDRAVFPVHCNEAHAAVVFRRRQEKLLQSRGLAAAQPAEAGAAAVRGVLCPATSPAAPAAQLMSARQLRGEEDGRLALARVPGDELPGGPGRPALPTSGMGKTGGH